MARPKKPEGPKEKVATRLPAPVVAEFERIAAIEGMTPYKLAARVLTRYVETYPLDEFE